MTLGQKLHNLRKEHGYTQDKLSEILDVSRQSISKWELDESVPEISKIVKLAEVYEVTTDYLLLHDETHKSSDVSNNVEKLEFLKKSLKKHGYKAGYLISAYATFVLVICQIAVYISNKMLNDFSSFGGIVGNVNMSHGVLTDITNSIVNPVAIVGNIISVIAIIFIIGGIFLAKRLKKSIKP